jgi:NNP family nitrate/nitrite transporter-like MFS transporter
MPNIERDLGLTHGEAGTLFLLLSVGYFITLLASGFISSRLLHRRTIVLSATALGFALLGVTLCGSLWSLRFTLLAAGMAAGIYLPSGIATLTDLVSPKNWGKAIAVHELAPNLSFVTAPLVCEILLLWFSWRGVLASLGVASIFTGLAFIRFGRGGNFQGQAPSLTAFRALFRDRSFWIMMVLFSLGISGTLGIYTMLPLYLVNEHGLDRNWANTLIAFSRISGLGVAFVSGWVTDRWGPRRTLAVIFLLTAVATFLLGYLPRGGALVMVFIQPIMAVCFFPPGFAALSSIGPPGSRNVAVSLTVPAAFIVGGGAIPTWIGLMGDAGAFSAGIQMVGAALLVGFALSLLLRRPVRPG